MANNCLVAELEMANFATKFNFGDYEGFIEERDKKIKAMNVDELIENLKDENGYGKFVVMEMKERFDTLEDVDKMKIINTLMATTKANKSWAEGKMKKMNID